MIHKAIELWVFPGNPGMQQLLEASGLDAGLAHKEQRTAAVSHSMVLLKRFYDSPLRTEIDEAAERYHELPYTRMAGDHAETGYIDLLYRTSSGWQIVDFKTDIIKNDGYRADLIKEYSQQMQRYASVIPAFLGQAAQTRICFLDDLGKVELVKV